jgi:hypothetical protein
LSKKEISICRKKVQIENPYPFARKDLAYFSASFRSRPALFHFAKTRPDFAPLRFKKANTFLCAPPILSLTAEKYKKKMQSGMIIYLAQVLSQS